jgi:ubiquinone/menaquinone biosynthesis C-methylase UbiE
MMQSFHTYIDRQYKMPSGLIGYVIGEKMVKQHQPETHWTISLLDLNRQDTVLELGCGAGYALNKILKTEQVRHVTGVDLSPAVLKLANRRNRREIQSGRAELVNSSVDSLPLENECFHKIFSIHSLYFWEDLQGAVNEMHRVLIPGGMTILTICNGKDGEAWPSIEELIERQLIPVMTRTGFHHIEMLRGPDSRGYHTVAIVGEKK